jgi:hypothetical protein
MLSVFHGLSHHAVFIAALAIVALTASAQPRWSISPPIIKESKPTAQDASKNATPAPMRKEEAREKEEFSRLTIERIFVEGSAESRRLSRQYDEQRFAAALNRGNPEVPGGKIRHGAFYDGYVYWGSDPSSFLWLNTINPLRDLPKPKD